MGKTMRRKREKKLRSIKQAAALNLPQPALINTPTTLINIDTNIDVDMGDNKMSKFLKPSSRKIGKNMKKKVKIAKNRRSGKGQIQVKSKKT